MILCAEPKNIEKKLIPGFTSRHNLTKLIYYESYDIHYDAFRRERQLKNWRREWKDNLIRSINPDYQDLLDEVQYKLSQ